MKQGWEIKTLGAICLKITDGSHNPPKGVLKSDYLMLSSKNIYDDYLHYDDPRYLTKGEFERENKRTEIKTNDVLLTIVGTIGRVAVVPSNHKNITLQRSVAVLKVKQNVVDSRFLMFSLRNLLKVLTNESRGVAQKGIYLNQLRNIELEIPALSVQRRIVSILDKAFAAIDKAKANAEQNLKNAKELFDSYLQSVFENSGSEWEEKKLSEVCQYDKIQNKHENLPYVGLEDIESNTGKFIGPLVPRKVKSATFVFTEEHVLYGRLRPYLNKVFLPHFKGHCSTEIFPIKTKGNLDRRFLFRWLMKADIVKRINATWTGARMPRANMHDVLNFRIGIPPLHEQQTIVQKLDLLSAETKKLEAIYKKKIEDLEELKKSILQKAFSGEL